jgi:hypothetical protein
VAPSIYLATPSRGRRQHPEPGADVQVVVAPIFPFAIEQADLAMPQGVGAYQVDV